MTDTDRIAKARYVMIGGFLGAGKSTAVARLARQLTEDGLRVGLITNDQATGLVDSVRLRSHGFRVEEIAGGCFCCRFDSLVTAAERLTETTRPDVFIAEPVGSCTDLVATVSYPLRRIYGDRFHIAPLSVLVDPVRAARVLGLEEGRGFSSKVTYVYRKQLEEAHVIVINKCDLLDRTQREELRGRLAEEFPGRAIHEVSALEGSGLGDWFAGILSDEAPHGRTIQIDYDEYADGEALLGWLNATLRLFASEEVDGNAWLHGFAARLGRRLAAAGGEVAHLKATLLPEGSDGDLGGVAAVSLVRGDFVPELAQELLTPLQRGEIVLNLRAEAAPEVLRRTLEEELKEGVPASEIEVSLEHVECFRPGRPVPTHRDDPREDEL